MRRNIFLWLLLVAGLSHARAQTYFEGELDYNNIFLHPETSARLFDDIPQTYTLKGGKCRLDVPDPLPGSTKLEIDDFVNGKGYEFKDSSKVSKDSAYIPRIYEKQLCGDSVPYSPPKKYLLFTGLANLDTMMVVAGLNCHVMVDMVNNIKLAEYYYCDSIKLDPRQYECPRLDGDDRLYKFTKGSLITQRIRYDVDSYIYVLQLQAVREKKIDDKVFELPKDIAVVPLNK